MVLSRGMLARRESRSLSVLFLYHHHVLPFFVNVASTQGQKLRLQNTSSVGTRFFSRMPTSPFARDARWTDSICRANLSFPCLVDSRMSCPCHMNLYQ